MLTPKPETSAQAPDPNSHVLCYLGLGSNIGDRASHLKEALLELQARVGSLTAQSQFYETAPWGFGESPEANDYREILDLSHHPEDLAPYLNLVVALETSLKPSSLLEEIQSIERDLGRNRSHVYAARTIDIDLLIYGKQVIESDQLRVPHPRMLERRFVLEPLHEIAPDFQHPSWQCSVADLLARCLDQHSVRPYAK